MSDDVEPEMELVMPFVTTVSHGGPHDDASYVAGFQMGELDCRLGHARHVNAITLEATVHVSNVDQLELIAMKWGYLARVEFADNDWAWVQFRRTDDDD